MNRRYVWIALAALAAGALLTMVLLTGSRARPHTTPVEEAADIPTPTPAPSQRIVLLFGGIDGMLHPELREVPLPEETAARMKVVLDEILAGPKEGLLPIIPYRAEIRASFVDQGRQHAFVDLTPPPEGFAGTHDEVILVYGVVNTVLLNCPELKAVQLLFGGEEVSTLTGHLDCSRPLPLNKQFIAAS